MHRRGWSPQSIRHALKLSADEFATAINAKDLWDGIDTGRHDDGPSGPGGY